MFSATRMIRQAYRNAAATATSCSLSGPLRRMLTTSSSGSAAVKSFLGDLYSENKPDRLVHKFKQASQSQRFRAKHAIYARTIRRLALWKRFESIEEILEHQKTFSDITKEGFHVRIIKLYGASGMLPHAHKTFDEMPHRNCPRTVLSLNALLASYLRNHQFPMVHTLFNDLPPELSIEPNLVTYNTVMKAFCEMGSFDPAISMIEEMEQRKGLKPDLITFNTLLDGLYSEGRFEDGDKIWKQMECGNFAPNVLSYNSKLLGMCLYNKTDDAVVLYQKMASESEGVKPNLFSINALIRGFVNEDNLEEAKKWYGEITKSGFTHDRHTLTTLVPFLCDKGDLKTAFEVSKEMLSRKRRDRQRRSVLQLVVNSLVKNSMISEAEEIVKLENSSPYYRYDLKLPRDS